MKNISIDLLRKYNVQGPRYTSYPPAPSWKTDIGVTDLEKALSDGNHEKMPAPLSLYLHLPFCERLCYFCGCTTVITGRNRSFEKPYHESILKEVNWYAQHINNSRRVVQLHLGGGTPTYSSPEELKVLTEKLKESFSFDPEAEMGIEVDPRVTTSAHLKTLGALGFNRISMGVQDFNPDTQKAVNRIQSTEQTRALVKEARSLGFSSVNIDLIYGLPHQTTESFAKTIQTILEINPDRLAVYSYAHVPWLKEHQEHFEQFLPQENQKYEIFLTALKLFTDAGYNYIGMDHFAKPNDELSVAQKDRTLWRNFMGYTTKAGTDLLGLGMSAIGSVHGGFFQNQRELKAYQEAISRNGAATMRGFILSKDDRIRSRVIQNLLCHAVVVKSEIEKEFGIQFDSYFADSLEKLKTPASDGLVTLDRDRITPTEIGRIFLRNLAMPFDAYLPKEGEKRMYSKTV